MISPSRVFGFMSKAEFHHQRHKEPSRLDRPRELVIVCPPMQSHVNSSRIVRAAGCCGVKRVIACGATKIDRKIARDAVDYVQLETPRSLIPVLRRLKSDGFELVALEQTTDSAALYDFVFQRQTALVIGHERTGLGEDILSIMDQVAEIPVYGLPHSHNAATAAAIAMYEYCRQFPNG